MKGNHNKAKVPESNACIEMVLNIPDKIAGMICGLAIGDASGAPYEFMRNQKKIDFTGEIEKDTVINTMWSGKKTIPSGTITDDTEMSLVLIRSIIKNKGYNRNDIILGYEEWAKSTWALGKHTRSLFKGIKTVKGYEKRYDKIFSNSDARENMQSNGSLMRCSPLVVLTYEDWMEDTDLTNPSSVNNDCTNVYLCTIRDILLGISDEKTIFSNALKKVNTPEVKGIFKKIQKNIEVDVVDKKGWVLHPIYLLYRDIYAGKLSKFTLTELITDIVLLGGDTDTNAAICGAVYGVYKGISELDKVALNNMSKIFNVKNSRPSIYRIDGMEELMEFSEKLTELFMENNSKD